MPLNSIPPTTTVANLELKRQAAMSADLYTDVGFWGGVIPGNDVRFDFGQDLSYPNFPNRRTLYR
jgi:dihydroorotase-like cyclic amidohydrolase